MVYRDWIYPGVMFMIMIMICDGDYVLMILTILESHECDSFPVSAFTPFYGKTGRACFWARYRCLTLGIVALVIYIA